MIIRFVTDSTCDIPPDRIDRYGIGVVPCFVNYNGQSFADDGVHFQRDAFYAAMPTIHPPATTAGPPPALAEQVIRDTFEGADHLVIITVPARLSGTYNTLRLAASSLPPDRVTLIDSGMTTMALGWQVLAGAETAEATGDLDAVLDAIRRVREHQRLYAVLATLEYLRHSGRVSWAAASVGGLLQIKPIIELRDGEVMAMSRVRTFGRALDELANLVRAQAPLDRLAILHAHNLDAAQQLHAALAGIAPPETVIVDATPVIGTHTGPGAVGVATVRQSWRA